MDFKKYSAYSVDEFLEDPAFRNWITNPNAENDRFWKEFLLQYPGQKMKLEQARYILRQMNEYFAAADQAQAMADGQFRERLLRTMETTKARKQAKIRRLKIARQWTLVASIALVVGVISWLWLRPEDRQQIIATGFGEWKTVELPDGSTVKLNANSEIRLADQWREDAPRQVWLQGEAFFEVEKKTDAKAKFQVITDDLTVEVFGTSFNVRSRGEQTSVFLEEGKIRLDMGTREEFLDPGDFVAYSAREKMITQRHKATAEKHTSWKDGTLILKNTSTGLVLNKIEELYGLDVQVEKKEILDQEITVMVPMDKIEIAIPILERTLNAKISKTDNQLIIK